MSEAYPTNRDFEYAPIIVCTPGWLPATLRIVNQVSAPTGPFIDLLNRFPLPQLEEELEKVRGQIGQLDTAARLLELAIQARRASNGNSARIGTAVETDTAGSIGGVRPKLKTAILGVMQPGGDRVWSPIELHQALAERGWAPTGSAARSQISNRLGDLVESGQVVKPEKGLYKLVRTDGSE